MKDEEVWVRAWTAAMTVDGCTTETATDAADLCLADFHERFRGTTPTKHKKQTQFQKIGDDLSDK